MNPTICLALNGLGGLIIIVSFFLPWIGLDSGPVPLSVLAPLIENLNPQIGALVDQFVKLIEVTGYDAAFSYSFLPSSVRILTALPVGFVVLAALGLGLSAMLGISLKPANGFVVIGSVLMMGALLINIPLLNSLGFRNEPLLSGAMSILGFGVTIGFWGSVVGLLTSAVGAGICLARTQQAPDDEFPYY